MVNYKQYVQDNYAIFIFFIYLLIKSNFLGLINTHLLLIGPVPLFYLIDVFLLLVVLIKVFIKKELTVKKNNLPWYFFLFLILTFASIIPILTNLNTIYDWFLTFKEFSSLFLWPFLFTTKIKFSKLIKQIKIILILISILFLINYFNISNFGVFEKRIDETGFMIRVPLFLIFMLYILYSSSNQIYKFSIKESLMILLFLFVLYNCGYRSVFLLTIISLGVILFLKLKNKFLKILIVPILVLILMSSTPILYEITRQEGAIASRNIINEMRFELIKKSFLFGYGIIGKDSDIGKEIMKRSISRHDFTIGTIDSGYVDLLLKFGLIGTLFYLLAIIKLTNIQLKSLNSFSIFILAQFFICYTLSVFTYNFGLMAIIIAAYLNIQKLKNENLTFIA